MVKRLYVDNYKCLVNFELRFQDLMLLIGRNGAGKTAVFNVIYALRQLLVGHSRVTDAEIFPHSTLTRWQDRPEQVFQLHVELEEVEYAYSLQVEHRKEETWKARVKSEILEGDGEPLFKFELGKVRLFRDDHSEGPAFMSDWRESALARVPETRDNKRLSSFLEFARSLLVCGLAPRAMSAEARSEDQTLARDGHNFVNWYRHIVQEQQHIVSGYTQEMLEAIDGLSGFRLEKVGIDARVLTAVFGDDTATHEYRFNELSDGQRAIIVLYALTMLTADQGQVLLIDEPVNFVALPEIQPWLVALRDAIGATLPQVVLASHHPEIIDYLGANRAVLLFRKGTGPTRGKSLSEHLGSMGANGALRISEWMARDWV